MTKTCVSGPETPDIRCSENEASLPFDKAEIGKHVALLDVRTDPIDDKIRYLCERVAGKRVLDVGIVEHDYQATSSGAWLHRHLSHSAASCLGLDVLPESIKKLRADGYNVQVHDLSESSIEGIYDIVIMGELIEHVGVVETLLRNVSLCLEKNGSVLITTPNPWYVNTLVHAVRRGFYVDNVDHVAWYDPGTILALAQRCGFELVAFAGLRGMSPRTIKGRVFAWLVSMLCKTRIFPLLDCKSILYELRLSTKSAGCNRHSGT